MNEKYSIVVQEENDGIRLDMFLTDNLIEYSRSYIQKLILDGEVCIDKKIINKKNIILKVGQFVELNIPPSKELNIIPVKMDLDIIYEDEDVIVINKPRGLVVHPAPGNYENTLVSGLLYKFQGSLSSINGVNRPGIVHRIDKDTTGLLIVAKNDLAHKSLTEQLKDRSLSRTYLALVHGTLREESGTINKPIGRDKNNRLKMSIEKDGRNAVTHFKKLEEFISGYTFLELKLETGRTHQIRVHLSSINHPIVGDMVYNNMQSKFKKQGQLLHAYGLKFIHPRTGMNIEVTCPLPEDFEKILYELRK
jgi:23S rRNA pseudouridine1911/1915/1917 synthase